MQNADHVDPPGREQVGEPLPFAWQETRLLDVALPVLDVVLGVRDIPVATEHRVDARCGQGSHPRGEAGHEALLLELTIGAGLTGLDVQARHGHTCGIGLQIASVRAEFNRIHQPCRIDRIAREDGDTTAPLDVRLGGHQLPSIGQRGRQRRRVGVPPACEGD